MKKNVLLLLTAFCLVAFANGQSKNEETASEGKVYSVKLKKMSGSNPAIQWSSDEFIFRAGKFKSKVMSKSAHFDDARCKFAVDTVLEKTIHFEATGKNKKGLTVLWRGTVKGESISGTAICKNGQATQSYTFSGKVKSSIPSLAEQ